MIVNDDLIEHIETAPDTVIALTTGQRILVIESADEVVARVLEFKRATMAGVNCPVANANQAVLRALGDDQNHG
jgi:flagellar protein FlbD